LEESLFKFFILLLLPIQLQEALQLHPSVITAKKNVELSELNFAQSEYQTFSPLLSTSGSHSNNESSVNFDTSESSSLNASISWLTRRGYSLSFSLRNNESVYDSSIGGITDNYSLSSGFSLSYPLFSEKRKLRLSNTDISAFNTLKTHIDYQATLNQSAYDVISRFWDCLILEENLALTRLSLKESQQQQSQIEARINTGTLAESEIYSYINRTLQQEASVIDAEIRLQECNEQANLLFGREVPKEWFELVKSIDFQEDISYPQKAYKTTDVEKGEIDLKIGKINLENSYSQDMADFDLSLSYGLNANSTTQTSFSDLENPNWNIGLTWSKRLGSKNYNQKESEINFENLNLFLERTMDNALLTERSLVNQIISIEKLVTASESGVKAAEKAYEGTKARWEVGLTTNLELFTLENSLMSARMSLLTTKKNLLLAKANLSRFRGNLVSKS